MTPGDVVGHEPMGIVEQVGPGAQNLNVGDRVVVPFQIACGHCYMCDRGLHTQCETTQLRRAGPERRSSGYSKLYGAVPGGQADYLRVPHADFGPIKVPDGPPDDRFVFLSDVIPTAWQAVEYADVPSDGHAAGAGTGTTGDMSTWIGLQRGHRVISVDLVDERLTRAADSGAEVIDPREVDDLAEEVRSRTGGRGPTPWSTPSAWRRTGRRAPRSPNGPPG